MISLKEIQRHYPEALQGQKRFMLREYLQYKILEIIFTSRYSEKLCFMGGTCLRIVYSNTRFSEDLDFDNFKLTQKDFEDLSAFIIKKLMGQGYRVEVETVSAGAFHCHIKFPGLLFEEGLSGYEEEKILITLDTEPQHFDYLPDIIILNKFDVFTSIKITPKDILLAQKFFALLNRKRKKGRDFFDILFLLQDTKPNYQYLHEKYRITDNNDLKYRVLQVCDQVNLSDMAKDVAPFLFNAGDERRVELFGDYIKQIL